MLALAAGAFIVVNIGPILLMLLCVAVAVAGAWEVLVRRGVARLVAVVVVLAAVVGAAAVVLVRGEFHGLALLGTAVLVVLALVLARYALSWRVPRPEEFAPAGDVVSPARHPVLIMNPKSGGGKVERFHMVDEAQKRGIEAVLLNKGDDLLQLARDAVQRGADVLGMAGGDGSQAAVAAIAAEHDVAFVCVPVGTRMDFARDLGLDIVDPVRSLDAFKESVERRIDLGRVNDQVFVNNVSLGVYGSIVQSPAYRDAKLKTAADMLPDLLAGGALSQARVHRTRWDASTQAPRSSRSRTTPTSWRALRALPAESGSTPARSDCSPPRSTVRARLSTSWRSRWPDESTASTAGCNGRRPTSRCARTGRSTSPSTGRPSRSRRPYASRSCRVPCASVFRGTPSDCRRPLWPRLTPGWSIGGLIDTVRGGRAQGPMG